MAIRVVQISNVTKADCLKRAPVEGPPVKDKVRRFDDPHGLAPCLYWTADEVADWLESVGFKKYKENFRSHFIDGRKLIKVNAIFLPKIGVRVFDDIKAITALVRDQLQVAPQARDWDPYSRRKPYINPQHPAGTQRRCVSYEKHVQDAERILSARAKYCTKKGLCYSGWSMATGWDNVLSTSPRPQVKEEDLASRLRAAALANIAAPKDKTQLPTKASVKSGRKSNEGKGTDCTVTSKFTGFIKSSNGELLGEIDWRQGRVKLYPHTTKTKTVTLRDVKAGARSKNSGASVYHGGVYLPVVFHWGQMEVSRGLPQCELPKPDECLQEILDTPVM